MNEEEKAIMNELTKNIEEQNEILKQIVLEIRHLSKCIPFDPSCL